MLDEIRQHFTDYQQIIKFCAVLVKQCIGSVSKHPSTFIITNQYAEILIELDNTCSLLIISVISDLMVKRRPFPCETRMLAVSNDYC